MSDFYKYVNVSSGTIVAGSTTMTTTQQYTSLTANSDLDLLVGYGVEKYLNGKRVQVFRELNPTTGAEIAPSTVAAQAVTSTTATLTCDLALGNRIAVTMDQAFTMADPTNIPAAGTEVVYDITRTAGAGSFAITWSSKHKGAWPTTNSTANQNGTITGESNGTNIVYKSFSGWY